MSDSESCCSDVPVSHDIDMMYKQVNTFSDLISINIKFLKGDLPVTIYCLGPTNEETIPLLERLIKINRYGFYTVTSQPSLMKYNKPYKSGGVISFEQKGYIRGMIHKCYIENLRMYLLKYKEQIEYTIETQDEICTTTKRRQTNLTRRHLGKVDQTRLNYRDWEYCTNNWLEFRDLPSSEAFTTHRFYPKIVDLFSNECCHLFICTKEYGSDISIEDLLLDFFKSYKMLV